MTLVPALLGWLLALAGPALAERAVPEQGPILRGTITVDSQRETLEIGGRERPLAGFLLVEREDGGLVWARDLESRVRGYRRLVFADRRTRLVELAQEAVRARDHVTARRLYEWAKREGLAGRDERIVRKRVERAEEKPRRIQEKRIAAVLREEQELKTREPEFLLARARKADGHASLYILREALRACPDYAPALAVLKDKAPAASPVGDARAWLDFHLDLETRGFKLADEDLVELKRAKHYWRPDLYGIVSDDILVITAIRRIDMVAECALRAAVTVKTLKELFRTPKPLVRSGKPLAMHVFADRKNFAERVGYERPVDVPPYFRWELGTWNLKEDVSRFLCHDGIRPGNKQLAYTLVHEVTRHWLWSRCPRFSSSELFSAEPVAGYWSAAGFPGFLAESPFDLATGRIDFAARNTPSLSVVGEGARDPKRLLDWRRFLLMDREHVHLMNQRDPNLVQRKRDQVLFGHKFMMQGAAVCHYLFNAEKGRRRKALIDYITNYYLGQQAKLHPRLAFGVTAEELGQAVVAYAVGR